jgi:DNA helicase-2/ATP-dependent DNA helicase PcrA
VNPSLLLFLEALISATQHTNIVAVGDDDQSIFAFRGSSPLHFHRFLKIFPNAPVMTSTTSFRSSQGLIS